MTENTMAMDRRTYKSSLFFATVLFSILISLAAADRRCNQPYRYLDSDGKCRGCPNQERCEIGFTIKEQCGNGKPLQCVECREEKGFTCVEGVRQSCRLCEKEHKEEKHPCAVKNQAECGECLPGYYKVTGITGDLDMCLDCSEDRKNRPECRITSTTRQTPTKTSTTESTTRASLNTAIDHRRVTMTAKQGNDQVIKTAAKTDNRVLESTWPLMLVLMLVFMVILVILIVVYAYKSLDRSCGRRGKSEVAPHSKQGSPLRMKALADMAVVEDETNPLTSVAPNNNRDKRKPPLNTQLSTGPFLVVPGTQEELQLLMASAANSEANSAVSTPSISPGARGLHNLCLSSSSSTTTMEDTAGQSDDVFSDHEEYNSFQGLQLRLDVESAIPTPLQSAPVIQITPPGSGDKSTRDRSPVPSTSRDSGKFAGTQTTTFFTAGRHDSLQSNTLEPTEDDIAEPQVDDDQQPLTQTPTVDEGQDTKYREKLETALKKGKDISLKDGLQTYDVVQRLAQILDQGGVLPTDPSYQNVFQALGVPKDKIDSCHKNKTVSSPTLSLLQYLESYTHRYEKNMSDLIAVLHRYESYEAVMYLCTQVMNFKPETGAIPNVECES